eukprot:bmy_14027T0
MGEQETGRTAVPKVGIPVRRPLGYKRWEIKGECHHPQRDPQPSHGTATKSGRSRADQLVRKYLSRKRCWMVQTAEHAELRRGSGSRDYDYHKALGTVLPTAPRTPCNSSSRSTCALTPMPDILISGTLESGHPENLTCSVPWAYEWDMPPILSWIPAALTFLGPRTHLSSMLTLTLQTQDHGTNLTCQVTLPGAEVTTTRTVRLNCESWARTPESLMDGVLRAAGKGLSGPWATGPGIQSGKG